MNGELTKRDKKWGEQLAAKFLPECLGQVGNIGIVLANNAPALTRTMRLYVDAAMRALLIDADENKDVDYLWVKSYDLYNRQSVNPNHETVAAARAEYSALIADDRTTFAQFGARMKDGTAITLGEYRK